MSAEFDLDDLKRRMDGATNVLKDEFSGLRSGRASISLLEPIVIDAYGATMPLNQVSNISVPEPRLLTVQVWDRGLVGAVEKAIRESSLGLNPATDGDLIRVAVPDLNEERRKELVKVAHQYAEQARVSVRHVRRDGMDQLGKMNKAKDISDDEQHAYSADVQKMTDAAIESIDQLLGDKEKEIMQV